jgi:16S rRNA (uracil1498-N3)-methyltransferase
MNLLLLRPDELRDDGTARVEGRRLLHAREVLKAAEGDELRAGVLHGRTGVARILKLGDTELVLQLTLTDDPPPRAGVELLLAIPRPKALRKVLPAAASLGIDRIVLVNAARVEKSYFDSKVLSEIEALLLLGLEQARDTVPPQVLVRERFRPFVEDELDGLFPKRNRLVAHPAAASTQATTPAVLAIGPEGGWVPFELDLLAQKGFAPFTLGPRTLRTEVALPYALGAISSSRTSP